MNDPSNSGDMRKALLARIHGTQQDLWRFWLWLWGPGILVTVTGFCVAWFFVKPAPPRKFVIAAGPAGGAYFRFATEYAEVLRRNGIALEIRETEGSMENYELLEQDEDVHVAIVQGGVATPELRAESELESIASLFLEPVWVFHRFDEDLREFRELGDRKIRIGIGSNGSGTQALAKTLLRENGLWEAENLVFLEVGSMESARMLQKGDLDVAMFVTSLEADYIGLLLRDEAIKLMSFERFAAYPHRHPYLSNVTLARGVVDLQTDIPPEDVSLIAPAANLVATRAFHDALVPLLLGAAFDVHEKNGELVRPGRFPSTEFVEFPLNESARIYFQSGPPFVLRYLPFWVASAIDRGKVLLIPVLTLLIPLCKIAPPLYRWRIRKRIYQWYEILRGIERDLRDRRRLDVLQAHEETLAEMEVELDGIESVPLAYMEEFYNLRLHVEFVQRRVLSALTGTPPGATPSNRISPESSNATRPLEDVEPAGAATNDTGENGTAENAVASQPPSSGAESAPAPS